MILLAHFASRGVPTDIWQEQNWAAPAGVATSGRRLYEFKRD
jgi:hypothetical protein